MVKLSSKLKKKFGKFQLLPYTVDTWKQEGVKKKKEKKKTALINKLIQIH